MDIICRQKREHGRGSCLTDCPSAPPSDVYDYARVEAPADLPPADPRIVDVAVLDMNCTWPNLGHDSLVHAVQDAACDLIPVLGPAGIKVRAISFEVRRRHQLPEAPGGRFALYLGSGGPGHIDPRYNDGSDEGSQGLEEDPRWQGPFYRLLDAIVADERAALVAVCHTYGVMCLWAGIARPELRGPAKAGKSSGILENVLTSSALEHPWFRRFSEELPDGRRLRILDNRLYDLIPVSGELPAGITAIGRETLGVGGPPGEAMTMVELARDPGGVMPRVFGSNHHPEILDRFRQKLILQGKLDRGEVSHEWYEERLAVLSRVHADDRDDHRLHATSDYTLLGPMRFHLHRALRRRAEDLGLRVDLDEERVFARAAATT
jgi:hypothetical protein